MLIPYCKFENNCITRWKYLNLTQPEIESNFEYAYCSLFRNDFAIFGEYLGDANNQIIRYGVLNKNMEVVEPAIYSSLEFYPNSDSCFIGSLDTKMNYHDVYLHETTIFNIKNDRFWLIGHTITGFYDNLFLLVNAPYDLKLYRTDGELIHVLPFILKKDLLKYPEIESDYVFDKLEFCSNYFRIRYWTNGFTKQGKGPYDEYDDHEYWELEYWFFFNANGEMVGNGVNKDEFTKNEFMRSAWKDGLEELKLLPHGFKPLIVDEVYNDLLENGLLKSEEKMSFGDPEKYVFLTDDGKQLWSPTIFKKYPTSALYDVINFGQHKGESYLDVFKYIPSYIEWIIQSTDISFKNLNDFFKKGNPNKLILDSMSKINQEILYNYIKKHNIKSESGHYMINNNNIRELKKLNILSDLNFEEYEYRFSEKLIKLNSQKLNF